MLRPTLYLALAMPLATAWRNPLYDYKSYALSTRAEDETAFVFLSNCWADPGARSEVDFFSSYPTNFGQATPDSATIISTSSNYVYEKGGEAKAPNGATFKWTITNGNASTNAKAGTATCGSNKYTLLRDTDSTLYQPSQGNKNYNCIVVYRAQLDNAGSVTPPSNSTSSTTNGQDMAAATMDPNASPTSSPDTGLSTGAKAGIGIGVALGVLALLAAIGFFLFQRRKAARYSTPAVLYPGEKTGLSTGGPPDYAYVEGGGAGGQGHVVSELHHEPVNELANDQLPVEAPADTRYERVPQSPAEMAAGDYSPR